MSDTDRPARPRQLTMAGGFVIGGSVLLVLSVFDTFTRLHTVEMRDEIVKVLTSPTGEGLGLSVSDALSVMRVGLMVAAACAAAAAVLGVYALQRNRAARLALSILAVPILLTSPLTGGLMGALVTVAILMLWSGPARDWFAGRQVREAGPNSSPPRQSHPGPWEETMPSPEDRKSGHAQDPAPSSLSTAGPSTEPDATTGFGEHPVSPAGQVDAGWLPPTYHEVVRGTAVPVTVKVACILTWVFSGVVALLYAGMLVALVAAQDRIVDYVVKSPEWQRSNLQQDLLVPVLWIGCLLFLAWALGACLLAWFTWRRHDWARWLLAASATAALLAGFFAFPVGLLHQGAAALTIAGLFSAAARVWFPHRNATSGPPPGPPGPPNAGPGPSQGQSPPTGGKPPVW